MVLACKANAAKPDKDKDKKKNKKGGGGIVYSVPEAGTSFLLGPSWL